MISFSLALVSGVGATSPSLVLQGTSSSYRATIQSTCTAAPGVKYVSVPRGTAHVQVDGIRQLLHNGTEDALLARAHFVGVPWTCLDAGLDVPCYSPSSHYPALFGCVWHTSDGSEHSKVGEKLAEIEAERIPNTPDGQLVGYGVYLDCPPPVPDNHSSALTLTLTVTHRGQPLSFQGSEPERTFIIGLIPPPSVPPPLPPYIAPPPPAGNTASSWSYAYVGMNGWGSITALRFQRVDGSGSSYGFHWPLVRGWCDSSGFFAVHAGCGNDNGIRGCTAICESMGMTFGASPSYWRDSRNCDDGYPSGALAYTASNCGYKKTDGTDGSWQCGYGTPDRCSNAMAYCPCAGSLPPGMRVG